MVVFYAAGILHAVRRNIRNIADGPRVRGRARSAEVHRERARKAYILNWRIQFAQSMQYLDKEECQPCPS